jgi:hypothetical protein
VQRQPSGCVRLLTTALEKLESTPPDFLGVETRRFIPELRKMLVQAELWLAGDVDGLHRSVMPRVVLIGPPR